MRILALDPGGTTGWAIYQHGMDWDRGQLTGQHHDDLWQLIDTYYPDTLVYERFLYQRREVTKGVSLVLDSLEYIGVAKLWIQRNPKGRRLVEQTPHQGKHLWTDDKVKALGLWLPGLPHAMDATRHLLYFLAITQGESSWLEKLKNSTAQEAENES